jgi:electron transport complex protein RnfG
VSESWKRSRPDVNERSDGGIRTGGVGRPGGQNEVSSGRLISTLAIAGALAGFAIVFVHQWAEPRIEAHRAAVLRAAINEVLGAPESYRTIWIRDGALVADLPADVDSTSLDRVYLGHDAEGTPMGYAIAGELPGYQDFIRLLFGYDAIEGRVIGMKVLESKETPGLGDKIEKDSVWLAEFDSVVPLLVKVKEGRETGDEHEVVMITGATISSRTVIDIINARLEELQGLLDAFDGFAVAPRPDTTAVAPGSDSMTVAPGLQGGGSR